MHKVVAQVLVEYGAEIHENYSGKGMYGEETVGIVVDSDKQFYEILANVLESELQHEQDLVAEWLRQLRCDNMGTGFIYY